MSDIHQSKRIYIGGLSESVSENELVERFSRFGKVSAVSLKRRVDSNGSPFNSFAHLNLQGDETSIKKCFNTYQNAKWKGSVMKLQFAKESVLDRLQREREELSSKGVETPKTEAEVPQPLEMLTAAKGVPGTPVPGKKDWVVGKYGRAVPIMKLKKSYKIPMVKHDPSKYCHSAKIFKEGAQDYVVENSCEQLTWEINKPDSEITKKRKGEFADKGLPLKKKPTLKPNGISERNSQPSLSNEIHRGGMISTIKPKEKDELEIVKIGAVFMKPSEACNSSKNKFDSDLDSESESTLSSISVKKKSDEQKNLNHSDSTVNVNGFNKAGTPAFRGLSMLDRFSSDHLATPENNQKTLLTKKQRQLSERDVSKPAVTRKSALQDMSVATSANRKSVPQDSVRESSIVADHLQDATINSPSLFSNAGDNSKFKTSTPVLSSDENIIKEPEPTSDRRDTQDRLIPEFKGLGMLLDLKANVEEITKNSSTLCKTDSPSSNFLSSAIRANHTDAKKNVKTHRKASNSSDDLSPSIVPLPQSSGFDSQISKLAGKTVKHADCSDSESSTGTDEILLRHKEKKASGSSAAEKALSLNQFEVENKVRLSNKSSPKKVAVDSTLFMSEFVSGVAELEDAPPSNDVSVNTDCQHDSYDSDLDSNDFALVVRKLRQSAMQGKADAVKVKKRRKEEGKADSKEAKNEDKPFVTSLQSRLIGISGLQEDSKSGIFPAEADGESKTKKEQKLGYLSEKEKHREANQKRLEAMKLQAQQRQQQQQLLQNALKNIDSSQKNTKRIVFESSDNESEIEGKKEDSADKMKAANESDSLKTQVEQNQEKPGLSLFSSSDDESEDENYDEMFRSKPQFEGKKGEKLLKLENRFGDKRFKMDAKFADSDSEEEDEAADDGEPAEEEASKTADSEVTSQLKEEQSASLKVLENIVGKTTLDRFSEKINRNTKKIIDMNTVRFDPTKMTLAPALASVSGKQGKLEVPAAKAKQHQSNKSAGALDLPSASKLAKLDSEQGRVAKSGTEEFSMERSKARKEGKVSLDSQSKTSEKKSAEKRPEENLSKKTSVEVSSTLVDLFKSTSRQNDDSGQAFSLSQHFGNVDSDEEEDEENLKNQPALFSEKDKTLNTEAESETVKISSVKNTDKLLDGSGGSKEVGSDITTKMPSFSESDLSSDEGEEKLENLRVSFPSNGAENKEGKDEEMLNAGRVDIRFTKEQWHEQWDTLRQTIIKIYKKKHKDALKKKRVHGEQKRKREFLKNSREAGKKNRGYLKKR